VVAGQLVIFYYFVCLKEDEDLKHVEDEDLKHVEVEDLKHVEVEGLSAEIDELNLKLRNRNKEIQMQVAVIDEFNLKIENWKKIEKDLNLEENSKRLIQGLIKILPQINPTSDSTDLYEDILQTVERLQQDHKSTSSSLSYEYVGYSDIEKSLHKKMTSSPFVDKREDDISFEDDLVEEIFQTSMKINKDVKSDLANIQKPDEGGASLKMTTKVGLGSEEVLEKLEEMSKLRADLQTLRKEKLEVEESLEALDEQHQEEMAEILHIREDQDEKIRMLMQQMSRDEEKMKKKMTDFESEKKDLMMKISVLEEDQKLMKDEEMINLKKDLEEKKDSVKILISEVDLLKNERSKFDEEFLRMQKSKEEVEEKIKSQELKMQEEVKSLQQQRDQLLDQVSKMNEHKKIEDNQEEEIQRSIQVLEDTIRNQDEKIKQLYKDLIVKEQSEKMRLDEDQLKEELMKAQQKIKDLQNSKDQEDLILRSKYVEEKDQMMMIISQKTQENRKLKDEKQQMLDTITTSSLRVNQMEDDNEKLKKKMEGFDERLKKIVNEKDLEIESLHQKCSTLVEVLQQDSTQEAPERIEALMKDRDVLTSRVRQLLSEREQLVALVKSKHEEALEVFGEATRAAESVERDAAENSRLQIAYTNLVFDYEQLELKLKALQRDAKRFHDIANELEVCKRDLLMTSSMICGF